MPKTTQDNYLGFERTRAVSLGALAMRFRNGCVTAGLGVGTREQIRLTSARMEQRSQFSVALSNGTQSHDGCCRPVIEGQWCARRANRAVQAG